MNTYMNTLFRQLTPPCMNTYMNTLFRQLTPPCMNTYMNTLFIQLTPPYEYMSTPGNTAKLGTAHSNIQTAQRGPSLVGSEPTMH